MSYQDFTSLPPDQEREFIPYEQRSQDAAKSAWTFAGVLAGAFFLLGMFLFFGYEKPINKHAQDMQRDEGTDSMKKESPSRAEKKAAEPAKAEKPAAAEEGAAPKAKPPAGEG